MMRLRILAGMLGCAALALLTGCGGGDGGSSRSANVPSSLTGSYALSDSGGGSTVTFQVAGNPNAYRFQTPAATEAGTFTAQPSGSDAWNVTLTTASGTTTSSLLLTFVSKQTGVYVYRRPGSGEVQGQFQQSQNLAAVTGSTSSTLKRQQGSLTYN